MPNSGQYRFTEEEYKPVERKVIVCPRCSHMLVEDWEEMNVAMKISLQVAQAREQMYIEEIKRLYKRLRLLTISISLAVMVTILIYAVS